MVNPLHRIGTALSARFNRLWLRDNRWQPDGRRLVMLCLALFLLAIPVGAQIYRHWANRLIGGPDAAGTIEMGLLEPADRPGSSGSQTAADPDDNARPATTDPQPVSDAGSQGGASPPPSEPAAALDEAAAPAVSLRSLRPPVTGVVLTPFGWSYSKTLGEFRMHTGVDIKAAEGSPVTAALPGTVRAVERRDETGLTVIIDHGNGLQTLYGALLIARVNPGDRVAAGDEIGKVGNTALYEVADGAHLHFAIYQEGEPIDPGQYLR